MASETRRNRNRVWPRLGRVFCGLALALLVLETPAAEIKVFAAISLCESLREIADHYEKAVGDKIIFSLGASSLLARQIEAGATPDIFVSADEAKMDSLQSQGLILKDSRRDLLRNSLVVVVTPGKEHLVKGPADLAHPSVKRIALADPRAVPAGIYGKQYLVKQGLWDRVEKKIVTTLDVRAALAAVVAGNADAAIVYRTDAATTRRVPVAFVVPAKEAPSIIYPVALVAGSKSPQAAGRFLNFLLGAEAQAVFRKHDFVPFVIPEDATR